MAVRWYGNVIRMLLEAQISFEHESKREKKNEWEGKVQNGNN
jgi:hypothetical protein